MILLELVYLLIIHFYSKRKADIAINSKEIISTFAMKRLKSLRRLFIKENICFGDVEKIQIIIDELIHRKHKVIPFYDINKFIINPLMVIFISCFTVFLDHLTQHENIRLQVEFLLLVLMIIAIMLIIFLCLLSL